MRIRHKTPETKAKAAEYSRWYRLTYPEKVCAARRKSMRKWRELHAEESRKRVRAYYRAHVAEINVRLRKRRAENRIEFNKNQQNWRRNNREKRIAHHAVQNAVKTGKLLRPKKCPRCGRYGKVQGHHHNGYKNKLDIVWLCRPCHVAEHGGIAVLELSKLEGATR